MELGLDAEFPMASGANPAWSCQDWTQHGCWGGRGREGQSFVLPGFDSAESVCDHTWTFFLLFRDA